VYRILITCLGNICRSPTAEHLIINKLKGHPLEGKVEISSAGLINPGNQAAREVRKILGREMGMESIYDHRSRVATSRMMKEHDLILPMGIYEKNGILAIYPHEKTYTYLDWIYRTKGKEVADPYGMGFADYQKMVELLMGTVDDFILKVGECVG